MYDVHVNLQVNAEGALPCEVATWTLRAGPLPGTLSVAFVPDVSGARSLIQTMYFLQAQQTDLSLLCALITFTASTLKQACHCRRMHNPHQGMSSNLH